ncbi:MAG: hypothetical protein GVY32_09660 [Gammaproteobacteria bacterium]|jgi:hypothetical protein|nr:hypothetical protein [Gammaproteobacteria bacterium]
MKRGLKCIAGSLLLCFSFTGAHGQSLPDDVLALHWHPATAEAARTRTLAAAAWLEREGEPEEWAQAVDAIVLRLTDSLQRIGPVEVSLMDGVLPWLVHERQVNLRQSDNGFPEPVIAGIDSLLARDHAAGQLARMHRIVAWRAPGVWRRVGERLGESREEALAAFWAPLLETLAAASGPQGGSERLARAREQAERVRALSVSEDRVEQSLQFDRILMAEADAAWQAGRPLEMTWVVLEALARLTQLSDPVDERAREWSSFLQSLDEERLRGLRSLDVDLPVMIAMLSDAAAYMAAPEQSTQPAIGELADVYARLVLFAPELAFYLEQPVREPVRRAVASCNPDPLLVGPLPRETFERCALTLSDLLEDGLDSEEMVGGALGPFAVEFLRRELGLVSWQRAAYIDGHLDWLLETQCQPPQWRNVLEWSMVVDHLVRWVSQRPVFFSGGDAQARIDRLRAQMTRHADGLEEWIDCITGQGSRRLDPVMRLLARHGRALGEVERLLAEASEAFYAVVTRPGADIDLDGPADQVTAYRPQELTVGPCDESSACGARVELPVSRALLGLFPNAYLLADQLGMGQLDLCYERVRWVERAATPRRNPASRVADYRGRLSFDLVGQFSDGGSVGSVFRYRLTDTETSHYLFAADDPEILALECPQELVGGAISSRLPEEHPGLVPNRLTYFASSPTTPEARLLANWDQGAEWRDWFLTGDRVDRIEAVPGDTILTAVQAQLAALSGQRERQLSAPLINPSRSDEADPLALAMARVADTAALLRRVLELHYPRIIRQHAPVRSLLNGDAGLVTRDRVRQMRDGGVPVGQIPELGLERSERLREAWLELPRALRERGQRAPEVDYGFERLSSLGRLGD